MRRDSVTGTLLVAAALCIVCSVLVSSAAVGLRPAQLDNKLRDQKKNILQAAGLYEPGIDIEAVFGDRIEPRLVNLETGQFAEQADLDPITFDPLKAAGDPELSIQLPAERDIAGIKRRENISRVYLVKGEGGETEQIVLPVRGKGLWSTLYGFLALDMDLRTVGGLTFYEHGETPGLGGEVDNPAWKSEWVGKQAFDADGNVVIQVIRGTVDEDQPGAEHKVDGLAGATITARGVTNLVQFWLGEDGFGPFLENLKSQEL